MSEHRPLDDHDDAPPSDAEESRGDGETGSVTIYDVARLAGVNPSTVSRALNKPGRVSPATEKRIRAAATTLNYHVNPMARALPTGRTAIVGLLVSDFTNPVFFDVVRGAESAATARGYTLVLAESEESDTKEQEHANRLMRMVDGLILATPRMPDDIIRSLAAQKPVTVVNRRVDGVQSVVPDLGSGIAEAVRHLRSLGHRRIAYLAGPELSWMAGQRGELLARRCEWAQLECVRLGPVAPTIEGGRRSAHSIRDSGVTAVVAYNDLVAIGLMQELAEAGINVPAEISVLGFDDIFGANLTSPGLTTIKSPLREEGEFSLTSLLSLIDNGPTIERPVFEIETQLVVRASTGPAAE